MKRLIVLVSLLFAISQAVFISTASSYGGGEPVMVDRVDARAAYDISTVVDVNKVRMYVTNLGVFAYDLTGSGSGLEFPVGSGKSLVFAAGLWISAKVGSELRVAIGGYDPEFSPGPIDETGQYADPDDPLHRVYKIERGNTTSTDYLDWPADLGAPVDDEGKPLFIGDQTLWCVYNDANPDRHTALEGSTDPLGIEVQQTTYAFDRGVGLRHTVFLEFKIVNDLTNNLDSTYVVIWCDPDLGGSSDDLAGCDTTLAVGFAYNADNDDTEYGSNPPCLGIDLLKGPAGDSGAELPMVAFRKYRNGFDPTSAQQAYNMMKGFQSDGSPLTNPLTGDTTTYEASGDPVSSTGWLDETVSDKRFMLSAGPFTMEPGDTSSLAVAIIIGRGHDNLHSVEVMESFDRMAQIFYDLDMEWELTPIFEAVRYDESINLTWTNPDRADFIETLIRYSTEMCPASPTEGMPVPNANEGRFVGLPGAAQSFVHSGLAPGATYYYSAFGRYADFPYSVIGVTDAGPAGDAGSAGVESLIRDRGLSIIVSPNPSTGTVRIRYQVASSGRIQMTIYNTRGQVVRVLLRGDSAAGQSEITWDGLDHAGNKVPSGIYFARLRSGSQAQSHKIVLLQ